MKLSKWEGAILVLTALFLAFTAGWFLRGNTSSQPLRVETQRRLEITETAFPAHTPEAHREKVDINTADAEALKGLPGIGEKRAADIIADREQNGPYRLPEELTRVKGIGEETLAELLDYITTGEETQ